MSASLNTENEKIQARKLFDAEKLKVEEELRQARNRHKAKKNFNSIAFHDSILDRLDKGR